MVKKLKVLSGIYAIIHKSSGKLYVGSSVCTRKRWFQHKSKLKKNIHQSKHLQSAWNKYGSSAFEFRVLELVTDKNQLITREQFWLDKKKSYKRCLGYNVRLVAKSNLGFTHSDKSKKLMSISRSGSKNVMFGKTHSLVTRKKLRKSHIGQIPWNKGKKMSVDYKDMCRIRELGNTKRIGTHHTIASKLKNRLAHLLPRETRCCVCGCGKTFKAKVTSLKRFLYTHSNYGRQNRIKFDFILIGADHNEK